MRSNNSNRGVFAALVAALSGGVISGNAVAQQSTLAEATLEEITVTARRREENLMELPMSIQAITGDEMQAQGIYNVRQLSDFVPNVSMSHTQRRNVNQIWIRGVGGGFPTPNRVFGSNVFLDGHLLSGSLGTFMSTADMERVEVLRGPQGTLFGKNTTGGAVNVITTKPGPEFDSYVRLRAGEFGEQSVRAMINFPISDNVFARINVSDERTEGVYYNALLKQYIDNLDEQAVAVALRFTPSDNWTIDARLSVSKDRGGNRGGQCVVYPSEKLIKALNNDPAGTPENLAYVGPGPGPLGSYADGVGAWGGAQFFHRTARSRWDRPSGEIRAGDRHRIFQFVRHPAGHGRLRQLLEYGGSVVDGR